MEDKLAKDVLKDKLNSLFKTEVNVEDDGFLRSNIQDKKILITGAGGSIGFELSKQVLKQAPSEIILLDQNEYAIYKIEQTLAQGSKDKTKIYPVIGDIKNKESMTSLFNKFKPDIVYHTAAYKHIPLMEKNSRVAVENNVIGTIILAEAAMLSGVERFIFISTDKAVKPTSVMGGTKRLAEMFVIGMNGQSATKFSVVRFGNVLHSSGSVIPKFEAQISNGDPITLTNSQITRYFITTEEACELVMHAGALAVGGEVCMLDMGEPVRIMDVAKAMLEFYGKTDEIDIVEVGRRPGEKLHEDLFSDEDVVIDKINDRIYILKVENRPLEEVYAFVNALEEVPDDEIKDRLLKFVRWE